MRSVNGAVLLAALILAQHSMAEGFLFSHKDYELICDNTRTCRATNQGGKFSIRMAMLLARKAGQHTPVMSLSH